MEAEKFPYVIDKDSMVPFYFQLKQCVLSLIEKGVLTDGDMFPPESELIEKLDISRPTVRQALSELVSEGYLTRQRGKGTFVCTTKIKAKFLNKLHTFSEEMIQLGMKPSTKLLSLSVMPGTVLINRQLHIPPGEDVIQLRRLRYADAVPIMMQDTYLPYRKFEKLMEVDFNVRSLYDSLNYLYGVRVSKVHRTICASNATEREAELLETVTNKALCVVSTTAYTSADIPVEYTVSHYHGEKVLFSVDLLR